jgi:hypothetical protein
MGPKRDGKTNAGVDAYGFFLVMQPPPHFSASR